MERRSFLKGGALSILGAAAIGDGEAFCLDASSQKNYWNNDGYFHQSNVDVSRINQGLIRAKIFKACQTKGASSMSKKWQTFQVVDAEQKLVDWLFWDHINKIQQIMEGKDMEFGGAHDVPVASFGGVRPPVNTWNRSAFSINNAIKGVGFCPTDSAIDDIINAVAAHWKDTATAKMEFLLGLYADKTLWDMSKQVSLELYATPDRLTHSFRNWMENPIATICFMAVHMVTSSTPPTLPSYELRTIPHMIHPLDPAFPDNDSEFKIVNYINMIHDFFPHGGSSPPNPPEREDMHIGVIHYVCEEFDNYWGKDAQSKRVA